MNRIGQVWAFENELLDDKQTVMMVVDSKKHGQEFYWHVMELLPSAYPRHKDSPVEDRPWTISETRFTYWEVSTQVNWKRVL